MTINLRHRIPVALKKVWYGRRGEPYPVQGQILRFLPGTRPIRLSHVRSPNIVNRYDALQLELLMTQLHEGDTAIDIGAHYGTHCIVMAARCGQTGHVVAFEPDPHAREVLLKNLALNPALKRPIVEHCACSDSTGDGVIYSCGGDARSSLALAALGGMNSHTSLIPVPIVTIDEYLHQHDLPTPRWVKIDAEGAEIRILKGARQLLASGAGILCELHPYAWAELGNSFAELKDLAAASGRRIRYIDQDAEIGDRADYGTVVLER